MGSFHSKIKLLGQKVPYITIKELSVSEIRRPWKFLWICWNPIRAWCAESTWSNASQWDLSSWELQVQFTIKSNRVVPEFEKLGNLSFPNDKESNHPVVGITSHFTKARPSLLQLVPDKESGAKCCSNGKLAFQRWTVWQHRPTWYNKVGRCSNHSSKHLLCASSLRISKNQWLAKAVIISSKHTRKTLAIRNVQGQQKESGPNTGFILR